MFWKIFEFDLLSINKNWFCLPNLSINTEFALEGKKEEEGAKN